VQIRNVFPLSPIQHGMLYHHLSSPHSGTDIEQMVVALREPLVATAFRQAWQSLIDRHAAFQTYFQWEGRPSPQQVQGPNVPLPWVEHDIRALSPEEQHQYLEEFLDKDRKLGLDLSVAPLSRAALLHTGDNEWRFIWTFHHILADGQSYPLLIREAFALHDALREGRELTLPKPRSYRDYIDWLGTHLDATQPQSESFWRESLRGFTAPTPLPGPASVGTPETVWKEASVRLSAATTSALNTFALAHQLTMSTLVHAGWAFELSTNSGADDVVFGVTRACRRSVPGGAEDIVGVLINTVPLRVRLESGRLMSDWLKTIRLTETALREFEHTPLVDIQRYSDLPPGTPLFQSILVFTPRLIGAALRELGGPWERREVCFLEQTNYPLTLFAYSESELLLKLSYDRGLFSTEVIANCLERIKTFLELLPSHADRTLAELSLVGKRERQRLLVDWNATQGEYALESCIHDLFEAQVQRTPDAIAVIFRNRSITYRELNERSNQVAQRLQSKGLGPGKFVGIFLRRSIDLVVALLGTLKAGAAYLPMDPSYPRERLGWMLEDTSASVVLTQSDLASAIPHQAVQAVCVDSVTDSDLCIGHSENIVTGCLPTDAAYVIFTSGSSGRPKGVVVEHRNVTNFFSGMDQSLEFREPGTWLAVTSISFDISVLELFWTLTRGFRVVIQEEADRAIQESVTARSRSAAKMDFSLFYFAADADASSANKYHLLLEGSRYADQHGFSAVWTPERHFHSFGGLYPNPAVTSAAIAAITSRIQIRAGSVVLPLHDPIRIAEEWSVVDNLSRGRVGLSFASGWHANDFALMPQNYSERKDVMLRGMETIRKLWRGETVKAVSGTGDAIEVRIFPTPVQRDPEFWLTAAGNVETFRIAGRIGTNLLTNLLGQTVDELAEKITAYRAARQQQGHHGPGKVSLMLHTFVGPDLEQVRRKVRGPFLDYLRTSTDLIKKARWECPAFATRPDRHIGPVDDSQLTEEEMQAIMDHAFDRYFQSSGLFGTPELCLQMVDRLRAIGVDEIACLIDFGVDSDSVLESLQYLDQVRARSNVVENENDFSIPAMILRHGVTHLQCTPSLASALDAAADSLAAIRSLRVLLLGGESLPKALAAQLAPSLDGRLINMYGPTETTIWSTTAPIDKSGGPVSIGRPIVNTQIYIVDQHLRPVPIGASGELLIGGAGVARGYLNRPDLTAERFIRDPFSAEPGRRLYRTGDLARYHGDGTIEFLGRLDYQVKIRGHRIELGEIETTLAEHPAVRECVVVAAESASGDQDLVAYLATGAASALKNGAVTHWQAVWEETYANSESQETHDSTLNTTGWTSSYTGHPIPEAEMRDWVEHTVRRIVALEPKRVLEIGCGTGMLLFRIAPRSEHYHGLDLSAAAIKYVQSEIIQLGIGNVTLQQGAADQLTGLTPGSFDVVVLNSVIQYFPSADYLVSVLERVTPLVREGGTIFVGDVRSLPLNEAFHTSVELERAPAFLGAADLRQRVRMRVESEDELVVDPNFFRVLPQHFPAIHSVAVYLKRGLCQNEMTRFRYDVLLGVGNSTVAVESPVIEPGDGITASSVQKRLTSGMLAVVFEGIPNPRVAQAIRATQLLASAECPGTAEEIRRRLSAELVPGVDPEDLFALDVPYDMELTFSERAPDRYDAIFRRHFAPPAMVSSGHSYGAARRRWDEYTNQRVTSTVHSSLVLETKQLARERLPEYMVPQKIVVLEALPRTPNGKIDRKSLPKPDRSPPPTAAPYSAPQTEMEQTIAGVFEELLSQKRVGTSDNFFDLGANSLIMVQASGRLRTTLQREISLVDLFHYPTVSTLAAYLSNDGMGASTLRQSQARAQARVDSLQKRRSALRSASGPSFGSTRS
jgi:natural product biosynthesis luciferase-like monooxygenase protein